MIKKLLLILLLLTSNLTALTDKEKINYAATRVDKWFYKAEPNLKPKIMAMGKNESGNILGAYAINVPGVHLKKYDKTIKTLSIDYSYIGVNNLSLDWTYQIAKALQIEDIQLRKKKLEYLRKRYYLNRDFIQKIGCVYIPANVKLKRLTQDTGWLEKDYDKIKYLSPNKARLYLNKKYVFKEDTLNEVESMTVYRVLEELDRQERGWSCWEGTK